MLFFIFVANFNYSLLYLNLLYLQLVRANSGTPVLHAPLYSMYPLVCATLMPFKCLVLTLTFEHCASSKNYCRILVASFHLECCLAVCYHTIFYLYRIVWLFYSFSTFCEIVRTSCYGVMCVQAFIENVNYRLLILTTVDCFHNSWELVDYSSSSIRATHRLTLSWEFDIGDIWCI